MWTNHPWYVLYPTLLPNGYKAYPPSFAPADGSLKECWQSLSYIISRYCHLENYWRIDDKPVVCIWDPNRLEKNIGVDGVKQLFAELTEFARKLGHKGLHFHSSGFYSPNSKEVGYNTAGSYNPFTWVADNYQPKNIELMEWLLLMWLSNYGLNIMMTLPYRIFHLFRQGGTLLPDIFRR